MRCWTAVPAALLGGVAGGVLVKKLWLQKYRERGAELEAAVRESDLLYTWLLLDQRGARLDEYFTDRGCKTLAILGMNREGRRFFDALTDCKGVSVAYGVEVDNFAAVHETLTVYRMGDDPLPCGGLHGGLRPVRRSGEAGGGQAGVFWRDCDLVSGAGVAAGAAQDHALAWGGQGLAPCRAAAGGRAGMKRIILYGVKQIELRRNIEFFLERAANGGGGGGGVRNYRVLRLPLYRGCIGRKDLHPAAPAVPLGI